MKMHILIIHVMLIPNPFSLKTVAAYKSFDDYRLFNDGYVESF